METFRKDVVGRLLWAEADPNTRFKYTIWFDYTRKLVNDLHEGDLVAVPNFATDSNGIIYSIFQLVTVMPMHYALGTDIKDLKGYPGFVMQAAKSASADWTEQETESYEDTTKIICEAVPANLEYDENNSKEPIQPETAMAMVGKDVYALTSEMTEKIFNRGIDKDVEDIIEIGSLIRDKSVKIYVRVEDLIKTHFGVFGFTGVGKSNLISTMIGKQLSTENTVKIVLFDLMDEYKGILADQILRGDINVNMVCIEEETLLGSVFRYINAISGDGNKNSAVEGYIGTLLLPKTLKKREILDRLKSVIPEILGKIRLLEEDILSVKVFLDENRDYFFEGNLGGDTKDAIEIAIQTIFKDCKGDKLTPALAKQLIDTYFENLPLGTSDIVTRMVKGLKGSPKDTATSRIKRIKLKLQNIAESKKTKINPSITTSLKDIVSDINNEKKSSLYIVTSHSPSKLREFSERLGMYLHRTRRDKGIISPITVFISDEADEFMPLQASGSYEKSKRIIETLARRGRKFGIGVGIATQRSSYLDTKIMGQLHTYFISKLPREHDRKVVAEAFSLSPDQFTQTFKFQKGQWLLVSHEATGIDMPIPIQAPNAEDRIKNL